MSRWKARSLASKRRIGVIRFDRVGTLGIWHYRSRMATAQDAYKVMLRDHLSPKLRANGFKGSAGAYELPSQSHWVVLGIQASVYSSKDEVKFTLNCQVVPRDVWEEARGERPYLGEKPKPNTIAGGFLWHSRIGMLMPAGQDQWWSLRASDNAEVLAGEVAAAVRDYLLPAIRREIDNGRP